MPFSDAFLEEVRARASIAAYAGRKLSWDKGKTNRARGDFWACCPFHHEKSPSFHVLDGKGMYKCFGCGASGNIFGLVQALEGVSFREAVVRLADSCGITVPEDGPADPGEAARRARARLALDRAQSLFVSALHSGAGMQARAYLDRRGLDPETVQRFGIGFALDGWSHLGDALRKEGFTQVELISAGLVTAGEGGKRSVDVFRNRLMFPIHDAGGKMVGFGGRALAEGEKAKYLNSPDGPLFHKGRLLYRLEAARRTLAQQAKSTPAHAQGLVVAEGYLDVIALERCGVPAVAPLGTALTEDQVQLLWKSGGSPILCFDGDAAGQKAAARALRVALPHLGPDRTVRVLTLPEGQDPDDVYRTRGPEALVQLLSGTQPAVEVLFAMERDQGPLDTPEAKAGFKKRLQRVANAIKDPDTQKAYFADLMARAQTLLNPPRTPAAARQGPQRPPYAGPGAGANFGGRRPPWAPPPTITQELREKENARKARGQNGAAVQIEQLLIVLIDHPPVFEGVIDHLVSLDIADADLAAVRSAAISCLMNTQTVDRAAVNNHLTHAGDLRAAERVARWSPRTKAPNGEATTILEAEVMALLDELTVTSAQDQEWSALRNRAANGDEAAMRQIMALEAARRSGRARTLAGGLDEVEA